MYGFKYAQTDGTDGNVRQRYSGFGEEGVDEEGGSGSYYYDRSGAQGYSQTDQSVGFGGT